MTRVWVGVLAFGGGVAVGLFIAKQYAKATVAGDVHSLFDAIGLGGSKADTTAQSIASGLV